MKLAGIIAEYDPFHNGHAWQLAQARALGAERVAVAMSCGLTQRGALPLLPEAVRVRAALTCGADFVFALPAPCAGAGAEAFARAGVRLLSAAGCDALVFGAFGILEPQGERPCPAGEIDLVVCPGVAFTADGRRLGRGRGYYDRYLGDPAFRGFRVGVCYAHQLVDDLPVEPHDVRMDRVITG